MTDPVCGAHLGIDIGGQSIKGIRLESSGRISLRATRITPARGGAKAVLAALSDLIGELLDPGPVLSAGIGTPGAVDRRGRIAGDAVNIPGWKGTSLGDAVSAWAKVHAVVRNDGNLAAYAEWAVRAGSSDSLLFVGLGTGVGGGFVERGVLLGGVDDKAVEIGHVVVYPDGRLCGCGVRGCVEAYASGPSIGRLAADMAAAYDSPLARELRGTDGAGKTFTAPDAIRVYRAYAENDALAVAVDAVVVESLSRGCATGLAMLAPDCVVLGGGVLRGAGHLVGAVAKGLKGKVYPSALNGCRVEAALCGHEAGLWGAALYGAATVLDETALYRLSERLLAEEKIRMADR
ncbi:MAG: ROK family protein [Rectinemataceae bacterium]